MHLRVDLGGRRIIKKIFFKQKTAYEIVARDWSSDVCSSDLRNSKYLNELYSSERFIKLKFFHNNKLVGWSVALCTKLNNHKQFGNMQLGSIIDCLSLKNYEFEIINKTTEILKEKGSNLIVSNQTHIFWQNAFKKNIFIRGISNFIFASSKSLSNKIKTNKFMHITRGDGDGPINL